MKNGTRAMGARSSVTARAAVVVLLASVLCDGAGAADPDGLRPVRGGPSVVDTVVPIVPIPPVDLRARKTVFFLGRVCLPGFAPDARGLCLRHDDPPRGCGIDVLYDPGCIALPPDPAPYGPGAAMRLDY